MHVIQDVPEYRERAEKWDARETQIKILIAQGETDLTIVQFDGVDGVKELDVICQPLGQSFAPQNFMKLIPSALFQRNRP